MRFNILNLKIIYLTKFVKILLANDILQPFAQGRSTANSLRHWSSENIAKIKHLKSEQ